MWQKMISMTCFPIVYKELAGGKCVLDPIGVSILIIGFAIMFVAFRKRKDFRERFYKVIPLFFLGSIFMAIGQYLLPTCVECVAPPFWDIGAMPGYLACVSAYTSCSLQYSLAKALLFWASIITFIYASFQIAGIDLLEFIRGGRRR